jgi:hypothetical protein
VLTFLEKGDTMVQTNWTSLGKPASNITLSSPHAVQNADGRLEVLLNGSDGNLWHIWQITPGENWGAWTGLSQPPNTSFFTIPVAGKNADGRIEAFSIGDDGNLWHVWQTAPGNGWFNWFSSGKPSSSVGNIEHAPGVEINPNGRLEVFTSGTDGALWHIYQLTANGTWGTWTPLDKPSQTNVNIPIAGKNADGHLEVFSIGDDGNLWHTWQKAPGNGWFNWSSSGQPPAKTAGPTLPPALVQNLDGRLEVFVLGADGALWHIWQNAPNGTWSNWASLSKPPTTAIAGPPSVAQNKDGRLELLVNANDGALWHIWQTVTGKSWGGGGLPLVRRPTRPRTCIPSC